jgi:hypothetical protein
MLFKYRGNACCAPHPAEALLLYERVELHLFIVLACAALRFYPPAGTWPTWPEPSAAAGSSCLVCSTLVAMLLTHAS